MKALHDKSTEGSRPTSSHMQEQMQKSLSAKSFCCMGLRWMVTCHICRKYKGEEDYIWIYWQQNGGGEWFGTNVHLFQLELFQLHFLLVIGATVCILGRNGWALFVIFVNTNAETKYCHAETPKKGTHTFYTLCFSQLLDIADHCGDFILKTAQTEICRHAGASISWQQILSRKLLFPMCEVLWLWGVAWP